MSAEDQKKLDVNYWEKFENYAKPHSNELLAVWELHNLRQGMLFLEDFFTKLRILIKEANYQACSKRLFYKEGNTLTFSKAREMAKTDKSAERQLQLMNASEVNNITSIRDKRYQSQRNQAKLDITLGLELEKGNSVGIVVGDHILKISVLPKT